MDLSGRRIDLVSPLVNYRVRILRNGDLVDGKYRVAQHLSSGGMGDVYAAEHVYTHREVALKVMRQRTDGAEDLFLREAEAVSAVDHPGVVEMYDAGRAADGTWYAVFELLEGADLEARFSSGLVTPSALRRITLQLLNALAATHACGYVHRDVKPANVFVGNDPTGAELVKLLDFGIAAKIGPDGAPALGHRVGTLEYMSPEQARGDNVDGRTDIWSVGALMFRGLTGRSPVAAPLAAETIRRLVEEDVASVGRLRPDLPEDLVEIVDRALQRRPKNRWACAEDMAQALLFLETAILKPLLAPSDLRPFASRRATSQRQFCFRVTEDVFKVAS